MNAFFKIRKRRRLLIGHMDIVALLWMLLGELILVLKVSVKDRRSTFRTLLTFSILSGLHLQLALAFFVAGLELPSLDVHDFEHEIVV